VAKPGPSVLFYFGGRLNFSWKDGVWTWWNRCSIDMAGITPRDIKILRSWVKIIHQLVKVGETTLNHMENFYDAILAT